MMRRLGVTVLFMFGTLTGCAHQPDQAPVNESVATVRVTGSQGAAVHGFFVADGKRSEFSASLPMTLRVQGMSIVALGKTRPTDEITIAANRTDGNMQFGISASDQRAALVQIAGGFSGSYIPASGLNAPGDQILIVINPYWHNDAWVFDDPAAGLMQEPFVRGVPEMINSVVKDIPDAKSGFRLTASETPFPGHQHKLSWLRAEDGGNHYRLDNTRLEGWLCPALFRYFDHSPATLYIKVEPTAPASQ